MQMGTIEMATRFKSLRSLGRRAKHTSKFDVDSGLLVLAVAIGTLFSGGIASVLAVLIDARTAGFVAPLCLALLFFGFGISVFAGFELLDARDATRPFRLANLANSILAYLRSTLRGAAR